MVNTFWTALGASFLAAIVTTIGIFVIRRFEYWGRKNTIYSITFTVSIFTKILAATGMVLHEFPEGIITYLLLIRAGFKVKTSLILAFLAAALTTPLGMLVSYPYISKIDDPLLGALLAFSAGALVYVGSTHLLPQAEVEHKKYSLFALSVGVLVALAIILSKA